MDLPAIGDRIELVAMPEDPCPIEPGATGTVRRIVATPYAQHTAHQICVDWDVPRSLTLIVPPDQYRIIEHAID